MAERFFPTKRSSGVRERHQEKLSLVSGPVSSGKTSLLFQLAVNVASASETTCVVFICHRKRVEAHPPFLSQGLDPSSDVFSRIQMNYVDDDEGIRNYFAAFHLHLHFPAAVLIDDFGDYFSHLGSLMNSRGRDMAMVRVHELGQREIRLYLLKDSPIRSLIETGFGADRRSDVRLYYGARNLKRMAYQDKFKEWESSGVKVVPVLSQPDDGWSGETGYVQAAFARAKQVSDPKATGVVLCGQKQMAEEITAILVADGVSNDKMLKNF